MATNFPMKQIMFSAYHLKEETVNDYYKKLNHARLSWLHGYPSQIAQFAQLCKSKNLTTSPTKMELITLEKNIRGMRHLDIGEQQLTSTVLIQIKSMKSQK